MNATEIAQRLDRQLSGAGPRVQAAVRDSIVSIAEGTHGQARENPGVTALAIAFPNPAPADAPQPVLSGDIMKNPRRVLAGKLAWASKTPAQQRKAIARMNAGRKKSAKARQNIGRRRAQVLSDMGLLVPATPGMRIAPPWYTAGGLDPKKAAGAAKRAAKYAGADFFELRPVAVNAKAKSVDPAKVAKRVERAEKRVATLQKKLEGLSIAPDLAEQVLAQARAVAEQVAMTGSAPQMMRGKYARSVNSHPSDASLAGYVARLESIIESQRAKRKAGGSGGTMNPLARLAGQASRKDQAAFQRLKAQMFDKYSQPTKSGGRRAIKKTDPEYAAYTAEYTQGLQRLLGRENPAGGAKGTLKLVGGGLAAFLGSSVLSGLAARILPGSVGNFVSRFAGLGVAGTAWWMHNKKGTISRNMMYALVGGGVLSVFARDMVLGLLSKIPLVGGLFNKIAGGTAGIGDLYDDAFGLQGLGDYEEAVADWTEDLEGFEYSAAGLDDDDDGMGRYLIDDAGSGVGRYVLEGTDDFADDDLRGVDGYVLEGYDEGDLGNYEEAVADYEEAVADWDEDLEGVGQFEQAVADYDEDELMLDIDEADSVEGLGMYELDDEGLGAAAVKRRFPRRRGWKIIRTTKASAKRLIAAGRAELLRESHKKGYVLLAYKVRRRRGAKKARRIPGGQPVTRRRGNTKTVRSRVGHYANTPGGLFARSVFGHAPVWGR